MNAEPRAAGAEGEARPSRSRVATLVRVVAVALVLSLLGLLVWDVSHRGSGTSFTNNIKRGAKPPAPGFALPVLWDHRETWPRALQRRLDDGRLALSELRGYPVVVN